MGDETEDNQVMMKEDRGTISKDIISRWDGTEVMKEEDSGGNAAELGRGNDRTGAGRKKVGGDETCRWQVKRATRDEENRQRDKQGRTLNQRRDRAMKALSRSIVRQGRWRRQVDNTGKRYQMATRRRMRSDEGEESRERRSKGNKVKGIEEGEAA